MANTQDFSKMMQDMMGAFPVDMTAMQDAFKNSAALSEKFAKVALEAAEKSTEISTKWTKETLERLGNVAAAKDEATDYTKAMTDFASAQAEVASENISAFAEVAKKVQMETVELVLATGKDLGADVQGAVKKTTDDMTKAAKKATASAK